MKFSEKWLREFCNPDLSTRALVDRLTMAGLEASGVEAVAAEFSNLVVAEVLDTGRHPRADKLLVCRVGDGTRVYQVVCGAPNVRAGIKVPFARVGARLPDLKVRKVNLRGVESHGILCSERELGLGDNHDGLMELPPDTPLGEDIATCLSLDDVTIDLDLTPNRGDCLSMIGLGRELGVISDMDAREPEVRPVPAAVDDSFPVELAAGEACPRFVGRVIRGLDPRAQSPLRMKEKLRRAGIRSIDPVVDVTNYVMLELGQPLHAYDFNRLDGKITVRRSRSDEALTLLDGSEVALKADTLLITDESGPIGLAGIMGGLSTAVNEKTRDIFLEGAFFSPAAIAGRARSYGLATDAAHRFERGVDWRGQVRAIERATGLLLEIAGGKAGPVVDRVDEQGLPAMKRVALRARRLSLLLGVEIQARQVDGILARLGFEAGRIETDAGVRWEVRVPSHRFDIEIEADLIEEIGRVYGYDKLPVRTPRISLAMAPDPESQLSLNRVKDHLVSRGYFEAVTYSFVSAGLQHDIDPRNEPLSLANPLSAEMSVMRTSIWAGLINALMYNLNRQQNRVRLFETGLTFIQPPGQRELVHDRISQVQKLAGLACGPRQVENWANDRESIDFFDIKGDLESLFSLTGDKGRFEFSAGSHPALHPGRTAVIHRDGELAGYAGLLDPRLQQKLDLRYPVYLFEIKLESIIPKLLARSRPISRYPEVRRDLAIVVDRRVTSSEVHGCIDNVADETLKNLKLFDVYQGKGIDPDKKSLALGLTFQHASRTLADEDISSSVDRIRASLEETFGARLRS